MRELNQKKLTIVEDAKRSPKELIVWLYENQGEMRFDASNRFFLILVNSSNLSESWKLKRNIPFLKQEIDTHLDSTAQDVDQLDIRFHWEKPIRGTSVNRTYSLLATQNRTTAECPVAQKEP